MRRPYNLVLQEPETNNQQMASHRIVVFLATATAFFGTFCFILLGLLIWREFYVARATAQYREGGVTIVEDFNWIKNTFPGFFRTPDEQAAIEMQHYSSRQVYNISRRYQRCVLEAPCQTTAPPYYYDNSTLSPYSPRPSNNVVGNSTAIRRRRQGNAVSGVCSLDDLDDSGVEFSACCVYESFFEAPNYLPSPSPQNGPWQIVQKPKLKLQQYFQMTECCQMGQCTVCNCYQAYYTTSAIVFNPPNSSIIDVQLVKVPGCCQCQNVGS